MFQGHGVADENGSNEPLRRYSQKTLVIVLPGDLTVFDIGETNREIIVLDRRVLSFGLIKPNCSQRATTFNSRPDVLKLIIINLDC